MSAGRQTIAFLSLKLYGRPKKILYRRAHERGGTIMSSALQTGTPAVTGDGFIARWIANVAASGRSPTKTLIGFFVAWGAFFLILYALPTPQGLSAAGQAALAVMAWACLTWIFESIPVGVSGLLIPMLLVLTNAVKPFPAAASGFVT